MQDLLLWQAPQWLIMPKTTSKRKGDFLEQEFKEKQDMFQGQDSEYRL
jgi:hypothetical protein